jgi:acetyl-CoA C-acetyltransferase
MGEVMPGFDKIALMKYPHLERIEHIHHAGNSQRHRRWGRGRPDRQCRIRRGARPETPRPHRATAKIGTDPTIMLTGPVPVTEKILRDSGMSISDIDLFEVNEAFRRGRAALPAGISTWTRPWSTSTAGPSPWAILLGATGAPCIIGTIMLDEPGARRARARGLATLCIASRHGDPAATIIEKGVNDRFHLCRGRRRRRRPSSWDVAASR